MEAKHTTDAVLAALLSAASRDNTVQHSARIDTPDGSYINVSVRKYSRTGRAMWRLDGWRASLATIKAAANGAEIDLIRGGRAAIAKATGSAA